MRCPQVWIRDLEKKTIVQRISGAYCLEWSVHPPTARPPLTLQLTLRYSDSVTCIISLYDNLLRPFKVIKHRVGQSLASAVDLFNEPNASVFVDVSCSKDGKVLLVSKNSKNSSEVSARDKARACCDCRLKRCRCGLRLLPTRALVFNASEAGERACVISLSIATAGSTSCTTSTALISA